QYVLEISGFLTPSTYPQNTPQGYMLPRHMFVMAAIPSQSRYVTSCTGARPAGRLALNGISAKWITCPEGSEMNSGHAVIAWSERGIDYAVSIHGNFRVTRKVCLAVAESVRIVR